MRAHVLAPRRLVCPQGCPTVALDVLDRATGVPVGGGAATMHSCRALGGLEVPMVPEGIAHEGRALEREDYVGGERVQTDGDGRPVMAYEVVRDDGTDRAVFAPCATAGVTNG